MKNQNISKEEKTMLAFVFGTIGFIFLIITFVLLVSGFTTPNVTKDIEKEPNTMLWKISGNGLEKDSYLFGTIHVICSEDYFIPNSFDKALREAEQVTLELDLDDPNTMTAIQQASVMPKGMHLKKLLSEEKYNTVAQFFEDSLGIPKAQFEMMGVVKPMILSSMTISKAVTCPTTKTYETEIVTTATKMKKEILGVETVQDQFGALDKTPLKEQAEILYDGIINFDEGKEKLSKLITAYKSQSVDDTYAMVKEGSEYYENFEQDLLITRNENWIPVMEKMAKEKSTFFAVGSGHLGGEKGVIQLLRNAGYELTPIQ